MTRPKRSVRGRGKPQPTPEENSQLPIGTTPEVQLGEPSCSALKSINENLLILVSQYQEKYENLLKSIAQQQESIDMASHRTKMVGRFLKLNPPTFEGSYDPDVIIDWIDEIEHCFQEHQCSEEDKVLLGSFQLKSVACRWWNEQQEELEVNDWQHFKDLLTKNFLLPTFRNRLRSSFLRIKQGSRSVIEYEREFTRLSKYALEIMNTEQSMVDHFIDGLNYDIQTPMIAHCVVTFNKALDLALRIEKMHNEGGNRPSKRQRSQDAQPSRHQEDQFSIGCNNCGKMGHLIKDCRLMKITCFKCGNVGHYANTCTLGRQTQEPRSHDLPPEVFTLQQLKVATRNFDPKNKIGEGGFGPVYKGLLSDGTTVAVKLLSTSSRQGNPEFVNEIDTISALQHPNLVKLYGYCIEANKPLLIYEYMENNCLSRALFGIDQQLKIHLDWPRRCRICLDIARGLAYLHEESRLKIIHRDIKPSNVLLDEHLNAKISDFGLAKFYEEDKTQIITKIAGTVGYMAPEYAMRGHVSVKADVYSFGVVVLEIVTGQSNSSYSPNEEDEEFVCLLDWACVLRKRGTLLELVDTDLGSEYSEEEAILLLNVALLCTNASPSLRPTMSKVVSLLELCTPVL